MFFFLNFSFEILNAFRSFKNYSSFEILLIFFLDFSFETLNVFRSFKNYSSFVILLFKLKLFLFTFLSLLLNTLKLTFYSFDSLTFPLPKLKEDDSISSYLGSISTFFVVDGSILISKGLFLIYLLYKF